MDPFVASKRIWKEREPVARWASPLVERRHDASFAHRRMPVRARADRHDDELDAAVRRRHGRFLAGEHERGAPNGERTRLVSERDRSRAGRDIDERVRVVVSHPGARTCVDRTRLEGEHGIGDGLDQRADARHASKRSEAAARSRQQRSARGTLRPSPTAAAACSRLATVAFMPGNASFGVISGARKSFPTTTSAARYVPSLLGWKPSLP